MVDHNVNILQEDERMTQLSSIENDIFTLQQNEGSFDLQIKGDDTVSETDDITLEKNVPVHGEEKVSADSNVAQIKETQSPGAVSS